MSDDVGDQLKRLRLEIEALRKKAQQQRTSAAATDARADAMVKEAASLGTPELAPVKNPIEEGKTYPQLARTAKYPPYEQ